MKTTKVNTVTSNDLTSTRLLDNLLSVIPGAYRLEIADDGGAECTLWIRGQSCQLGNAFPVLRSRTAFGDNQTGEIGTSQNRLSDEDCQAIEYRLFDTIYPLFDDMADLVNAQPMAGHPLCTIHTDQIIHSVALIELSDDDFLCWNIDPIESLHAAMPIEDIDPDDVTYAGRVQTFEIPVSLRFDSEFTTNVLLPYAQTLHREFNYTR